LEVPSTITLFVGSSLEGFPEPLNPSKLFKYIKNQPFLVIERVRTPQKY
jgi:hypothetical protein